MTFNKMRFPIVWITLAICAVLCAIEVHSGPVDKDSRLTAKDHPRSGRQDPYNEDSGEENDDGDEEEDDDGEGGGDEDEDEEEEERRLKRDAREGSQRPLPVNDEQPDEDSIIPSTDAPIADKPTKKPSMLLMLSNALDKAIAVTTKLPAPSQQIASDAASVFLLLGQVFTEAIDKVIGDDGPEESATEIGATESATTVIPSDEQLMQLPIDHQPVKVEKQPQINSSQSEMVFPEASS